MCVCGGGGGEQLQCKSESAQCSEKQQSPNEGKGAWGGLNFKKIYAGKTIKSTPKKKLGKGSYRLYFVPFSFTPTQ